MLTSALLLLGACASAGEDLSQFKQPASLVADLKTIQEGSLEQRINALADKSRRDQVFVETG